VTAQHLLLIYASRMVYISVLFLHRVVKGSGYFGNAFAHTSMSQDLKATTFEPLDL